MPTLSLLTPGIHCGDLSSDGGWPIFYCIMSLKNLGLKFSLLNDNLRRLQQNVYLVDIIIISNYFC